MLRVTRLSHLIDSKCHEAVCTTDHMLGLNLTMDYTDIQLRLLWTWTFCMGLLLLVTLLSLGIGTSL